MAAVKRDGRLIRSRSLWGAEGFFACACTANVPEAGMINQSNNENEKIESIIYDLDIRNYCCHTAGSRTSLLPHCG